MAPDTAEKVGKATPPTFQDVIMNLQRYWASTGCVVLQPYDNEVGAGTNAPATTLRSLGPDTWRTCYVQGCRRPTDGRYGENPNRGQFYYQFQVLIKPSPDNIQDLYLGSLEAIGIDISAHDVRFVEDDWESPTLGAWGLGWEIWIDGMEVTQFTYFQQVGGFECDPVPVEIAYGLERLTMFVQGVDNMYDIVWARGDDGVVFTYGDVYLENEREYSAFNFEVADTEFLFQEFADREVECLRTLKASLPLPAYDSVLKCCHAFNLLDARGVISATERMAYILRVRTLAHAGWHRIVEALPGDDLSERVQAERDLRLRSNEHVIEKLQAELASPTSEEPTENLSKLLLEYQSLVQTIHSAASPSITVLTSTANKAVDIQRQGLRLELEAIQARYEEGALPRSSYKRLRENVMLMQIDLEDNV